MSLVDPLGRSSPRRTDVWASVGLTLLCRGLGRGIVDQKTCRLAVMLLELVMMVKRVKGDRTEIMGRHFLGKCRSECWASTLKGQAGFQ